MCNCLMGGSTTSSAAAQCSIGPTVAVSCDATSFRSGSTLALAQSASFSALYKHLVARKVLQEQPRDGHLRHGLRVVLWRHPLHQPRKVVCDLPLQRHTWVLTQIEAVKKMAPDLAIW
jgi:hypothetical protein